MILFLTLQITQANALVYDRNHYFGLVPILKPKPKLTDTFGQYRNQYRNHISKGESSYLYWNNLALVLGIFPIIKGPLKPICCQILHIFGLFLKMLVYFQPPKKHDKNKN